MDNNTWVKLYRKIQNNNILSDGPALQIFIWALTKVNKDTGEMTTGRFLGAEQLKLKPSTFYKAVLRLKQNYKVIDTTSNNRMTTIRVLNWDKYQSSSSVVTQAVTTKEQQSNNKVTHIQEIQEIQEYNNILPDGVSLDVKPSTKDSSLKRKRSEKQQVFDRILKHYTEATGTPITNYGKQLKAVSSMLRAEFTEEQIKKAITYMATKDDWYQDKGFDLMTVSNQIVIYKSQAREKKHHATN